MFKVTEKETGKIFDVFDITYDAITGYPQFLIYKEGRWEEEGQWLRVSAKKFKPCEDEDPVLKLLDYWEREDLKMKYDSDSRGVSFDNTRDKLPDCW